MELRVIPYSSNSAYQNMSIDHALLESVAMGNSGMTLRLYSWKPSAVSIGRFQSMRKEVNLEQCKSLGIDFVRRITGGGAVYHDSEGEITYSLIAKEGELPDGIQKCYRFSASMIIDALKSIGINAEYAPINDITVDGKKISGNAQTRRDGAVLLHGTILYTADVKKMFSVLNVSKEKLSDKMIKSAEDRITDVRSNCHASIDELREALFNSFTKGRAWKESPLTEEEKERSIELEETVYRNAEWNFNR